MPYVSKAERDAASKMTRTEVLKFIQRSEDCDESEALRQMANAIGDGMLPVRWDDERSPPGTGPGPRPVTEFLDRPPTAPTYWLDVELDPGDPDRVHAAAPYDRAVNERQSGQLVFPWRFRRPLFPRVGVLHLWRVDRPKIVLLTRKTGPKTGKRSSIVNEMKSDMKNGRFTLDQLRGMSDRDLMSLYGEKFEAKRTACREARQRVLSEFDVNSNRVK
jgi:hypothetical protein